MNGIVTINYINETGAIKTVYTAYNVATAELVLIDADNNIVELNDYIRIEIIKKAVQSDLFFNTADFLKHFDYIKDDLGIIFDTVLNAETVNEINNEFYYLLSEFYLWKASKIGN